MTRQQRIAPAKKVSDRSVFLAHRRLLQPINNPPKSENRKELLNASPPKKEGGGRARRFLRNGDKCVPQRVGNKRRRESPRRGEGVEIIPKYSQYKKKNYVVPLTQKLRSNLSLRIFSMKANLQLNTPSQLLLKKDIILYILPTSTQW